MTQIVNLNELVGEDIVFQYGAPVVEYRIPGDVDVATVFELFEMFLALSKISGDDPETLAADVQRGFFDIRDKLLKLLQVRDPNLKIYPFGIRGTGVVLRTILSGLGVQVSEESPTRPSPKRATPKRAVPKKKPPARRR